MTKAPDGYRALGVGERVEYGDLWQAPGDLAPVPVPRLAVGGFLAGDENVEYFRPVHGAIEFETGAKRSDATGRGRFDLIPYEAMLCLARRFEYGVPRYGAENWLKGMPLSRILSSMRRHAMQINYDFSEDHLGAVLCNAAMFVTIAERVRAGLLPKELDDIGFNERVKQ